jgi:hypothetical protein
LTRRHSNTAHRMRQEKPEGFSETLRVWTYVAIIATFLPLV